MSSSSESDETDRFVESDDSDFEEENRPNHDSLVKLKSLRHTINWAIEEERRDFLRQLYSLVRNWKGQRPDLRDIFRLEEIDWLLTESVKSESIDYESELRPLVKFVVRTGYKDKPDFDNYGKPVSHRTTPIHYAARSGITNVFIVSDLFKIYDRFDVNYTDESGFSHFHAACQHGRDQVVQKFLKLGQDPNCVMTETGDSPLHLVLRRNDEEKFKMLLKNGADPNLANVKGLTPLHMIAKRLDDDNMVDFFFKTCDEKNHLVSIDPLDNRGRTPLFIAVSNFFPHMVGVLLDRGADLSKFVFPAENDFKSEPWFYSSWDDFRLKLMSGTMGIVEHLDKRGYKLNRSEVTTIMKFFVEYKMFEKSTNIEKLFNDEKFARDAKKTLICSRMSIIDELGYDDEEVAREDKKTLKPKQRNLSLYDLIRLRPGEAEKIFTFEDYYDFAKGGNFELFPDKEHQEVCAVHLCEKLSRRFFRKWALEPFLELTSQRLPILCCEMIIENLMNEDLWHICLAATDQSHKDNNKKKVKTNVTKVNSNRPVRTKKAPERLRIIW